MNKITGIIETTFDKLILEYTNNKMKCDLLEANSIETQNLLAERNEKLNELKVSKEKLDENLQQLKSDYEDVVQIKNQFYHNILRKKKLLDEITEQQNKLKQENENLNKECEKLKDKIFLFSSEKDFWRKRFEDLTAEAERLKLQSEHSRIKMCNIENDLDNCKAVIQNTELKILKNSENFDTTSEICEELYNRIDVSFWQFTSLPLKTHTLLLAITYADGKQ